MIDPERDAHRLQLFDLSLLLSEASEFLQRRGIKEYRMRGRVMVAAVHAEPPTIASSSKLGARETGGTCGVLTAKVPLRAAGIAIPPPKCTRCRALAPSDVTLSDASDAEAHLL